MTLDVRTIAASVAGRSPTQAAATLDEVLSGPLPAIVDCCAYLTRTMSLLQMASDVAGTMSTSIQPFTMVAIRARALAVVLTELVAYVESVVPTGSAAALYLAAAIEGDRLILGLAARGVVDFVGSAGVTRRMLRVIDIVETLGGEFQRGANAEGMVFGIIVARTRRVRMGNVG